MYRCLPCNFKCVKRGDWNRHICTPKHVGFADPMEDLRAENEQLKTLILEQQVELKKQFKQSPSPPRKAAFHLNDFLNVECKGAMNWSEFVDTFGPGEEGSDITTRMAEVVIRAAKIAGVQHRALHCLDAKRKKICVKLDGKWVHDEEKAEATIQETVLREQSLLLRKANERRQQQQQQPGWAQRESDIIEFVHLAQRISAPIDFSRFFSMVLCGIGIPKEK